MTAILCPCPRCRIPRPYLRLLVRATLCLLALTAFLLMTQNIRTQDDIETRGWRDQGQGERHNAIDAQGLSVQGQEATPEKVHISDEELQREATFGQRGKTSVSSEGTQRTDRGEKASHTEITQKDLHITTLLHRFESPDAQTINYKPTQDKGDSKGQDKEVRQRIEAHEPETAKPEAEGQTNESASEKQVENHIDHVTAVGKQGGGLEDASRAIRRAAQESSIISVDLCPGVRHRQGGTGDPYTWQRFTNHTYILSAYLENRQTQSAVRVVGVVEWLYPPKWCLLFYHRNQQPQKLRVHTKVNPEFHGKPYAAAEFICYLTSRRQRPCGVTLSLEDDSNLTGFVPVTSIHNTLHPTVNFTACIPPLFNFTDVAVLTENIEIKRQFGAGYFVVYVESVSDDVHQYLEYYQSVGLMKVVPWKLPHTLQVHYHGQLAALTDCMLQSMYTSKYVVFSDADEVIVPGRNSSNWLHMLQEIGMLHGLAVYLFRNSFISLTCENSPFPEDNNINNVSNVEALAKRYNIWSVLKRRRTDPPHRPQHYSKCIVDPQGVDTVGIHIMHGLRQRFWSTNVLPPHGMLWHYRKGLPCNMYRRVLDDRILEFSESLVKRISYVHEAVNKSVITVT